MKHGGSLAAGDIANNLDGLMKAVVFLLFLGCLIFSIWAMGEWQAGRWTADKLWINIGFAYGGAAICIGVMAWLLRSSGEDLLSDQTRRGFRVITRKDEQE